MQIGYELGVQLFSEPFGTLISIALTALAFTYLGLDIWHKIQRRKHGIPLDPKEYHNIPGERAISTLLCIASILLFFFIFSYPTDKTDEAVEATNISEGTGQASDDGSNESPQGEKDSEISKNIKNLTSSINNMWVFLCFLLVLMMQPGFAFLESGLIRSTNAINVLFKNFADLFIGGVFFYLIGYSLMWNETENSSILRGTLQLAWIGEDNYKGEVIPKFHFLFQLAFAMTAATICSGAVAGRIRLTAYFIATVFLSTLIYPISGYWAWSDQGWLSLREFHDFAGATVVHGVGGFAALAGAIVLGPRIGRFREDLDVESELLKKQGITTNIRQYRLRLIPPHSFSLASLGVFFLWFGWFGFNAGSEMQIVDPLIEDNGDHVSKLGNIAINTFLAGCGGAMSSLFFAAMLRAEKSTRNSSKRLKRMDLESMLNGILGGLVIITAGCDIVPHPLIAFALGVIAGFATVSVSRAMASGFGKSKVFRIDDPVGAFSVHGVCGVLGTIMCGFFGPEFGVQIIGALTICGWSFLISLTVFSALKMFDWLRVDAHSEYFGLDHRYHGKKAYVMGEEKV